MGKTGRPLIVVSNTSPLTNLAAIGQFQLLHDLFEQIQIGRSVKSELFADNKIWPGAIESERADWVKVHIVTDRHLVDALRLELDLGEAETIALALQLQADLVLLDEQAGRQAAQYLGLNVMGVVGLLMRAKQQNLLPEIRPLLEQLRQQAGFYLSQQVVLHALTLAGE